METNKRRRSSRLRDLEADRQANNQMAQKESTQSIGRRRSRSSSESTSSSITSKRRKNIDISKSELSVSTSTFVSTATTNRRRTRSLSKQAQSKTVTPSPVSSTGNTKFRFASPGKATDERRGSHDEYHDHDESSNDTPPGVVNLYRDEGNEVRTPLASFESPPRRRARTRKAKKQHQLEEWSHRHVRPTTLATAGGSVFDSSTTESLTIEYIRTYGEDYWKFLHDSERPVLCDPSSKEIKKDKPSAETSESGDFTGNRGKNNPLGSPTSVRSSYSSSSSSSLSTGSSKVTPETRKHSSDLTYEYMHYGGQIERLPQPHLTAENLKKIPAQPQLTPKMRAILVDWLIELSEHFNFGPSTLHLAVTLVDRVLASGEIQVHEKRISSNTSRMVREDPYTLETYDEFHHDPFSNYYHHDSDSCSDDEDDEDEDLDDDDDDTRCYQIPRDRFQLLGVTCVWLACKIKETTAPKASQIAYVSDHIYSSKQITRMERRVCNALNFCFFESPTPHHFLFEFMRASIVGFAPLNQEQKLPGENISCNRIPAAAKGLGQAFESVFRDMSLYLLELGRMTFKPTGRKPSLLAASAVYLARVTLGIPRALKDVAESSTDTTLDPLSYYWTPTLKHYTGYSQSDLKETVLEILKFQAAAESSNLKAAFNKYKLEKFNRVALKTAVRVEDLGFP